MDEDKILDLLRRLRDVLENVDAYSATEPEIQELLAEIEEVLNAE